MKGGRVLLCHSKGARNTYLPGGHVEFGERAAESLRREVEEEMGRHATVGRFLGAVEHTYRRKGKPLCEVNLIFEINIRGVHFPGHPLSREDHIEFRWVALRDLASARLEPAALCKVLPMWLRAGWGLHRWASTYGNAERGTRNSE